LTVIKSSCIFSQICGNEPLGAGANPTKFEGKCGNEPIGAGANPTKFGGKSAYSFYICKTTISQNSDLRKITISRKTIKHFKLPQMLLIFFANLG
jgi:hypothetical protein